MTSREFYNKVIEMGNEELTEFATAEIQKLDVRDAKRKEKVLAKAAENAHILERIYVDILSDDPITASEVAAIIGCSTQKATYYLKTLCSQEKAVQTELVVKGKGKVKGYSEI